MTKRTIGTIVGAIGAGSGVIAGVFLANRAGSAAIPQPVVETLASPSFLVPSIIVAACVIIIVIITIRRANHLKSTTGETSTISGFRVGTKTGTGT